MLCVGNRDMGDDGAGPYLADLIKGKVSYEVIDAGVTPENYTGFITRFNPDTLIIVDTVQFEGRPGEVRVFLVDEVRSGKISTHDVSLRLLIDYLRPFITASIYIVGIKPASDKFGEPLSAEVDLSIKNLADLLVENTFIEEVDKL